MNDGPERAETGTGSPLGTVLGSEHDGAPRVGGADARENLPTQRRIDGRSRRPHRPDHSSGVGFGQTDDPYDRILRAARHQFATQGFDGTTVRDIALQAEVNLAAIRYYFDSKSGLYIKILQQVIGPLAQRVLWQSNRNVAPLEQIEGAVREALDHIRMNPDMPALMVRELASDKTVSGPIITMLQASLPLVAAMVAKGQQDGSIRAGDPVLLTLSTFAQPVYLNLTRRAVAQALNVDPDDPERYARLVEHVVTTVRAALEQRPT